MAGGSGLGARVSSPDIPQPWEFHVSGARRSLQMAPPAADSSMMSGGSRSHTVYTTRSPSNSNASCRTTSNKSGSGAAGPDSPNPAGGKKTNTPEFLLKLYRILQQEDSDIISWDNGRIHVRNPSVLGHDILHKYFRHSKYSSFQRQLNYFGFRKTHGKGKMSACTYTNIQLHGGSLKSLLGCKRKTSSVSSSTNKVGSDDDEKEDRDDMLSDDESDTGPVITQPLKRQRSTSTASAAESVSTAADSIQDNVSVKSDDSSDMSVASAPAATRAPRIMAPSAPSAAAAAAAAASSQLAGGPVSTPRGSVMEYFFERDYMNLGSALPSPRGADDLFRSVNCLFEDFETGDSNSSSTGGWTEPPVEGSLSSMEPQNYELDYGNDLSWSDDSGSESPCESKDAFWWAKFQDDANVA